MFLKRTILKTPFLSSFYFSQIFYILPLCISLSNFLLTVFLLPLKFPLFFQTCNSEAQRVPLKLADFLGGQRRKKNWAEETEKQDPSSNDNGNARKWKKIYANNFLSYHKHSAWCFNRSPSTSWSFPSDRLMSRGDNVQVNPAAGVGVWGQWSDQVWFPDSGETGELHFTITDIKASQCHRTKNMLEIRERSFKSSWA